MFFITVHGSHRGGIKFDVPLGRTQFHLPYLYGGSEFHSETLKMPPLGEERACTYGEASICPTVATGGTGTATKRRPTRTT